MEMIKTSCPHCAQQYEVEDSDSGKYADCQSCGKRFRILESSDDTVNSGGDERLSMTTALVFQCIMIGFAFISAIVQLADEYGEATGILALLFIVPMILNLVFTAILHYKCWNAIPQGYARMTPGKAVGYLFVPFYGLYWLFPSIGGLGSDCEMLAKSVGRKKIGNLKALGLTLAIVMCVSWVLGGVPILGLFLSIGQFVIWLLFYQGVIKLLNGINNQF